jgi:hypothetical protein
VPKNYFLIHKPWAPKSPGSIYIYIYIYNPKTPNELTKPGSAAIEFRQIDDFRKNRNLKMALVKTWENTFWKHMASRRYSITQAIFTKS